MPIFDFKCMDCGNTFEGLVRRNDEVFCPECDSKTLVKLPSNVNFRLFGPGFYKQTSPYEG